MTPMRPKGGKGTTGTGSYSDITVAYDRYFRLILFSDVDVQWLLRQLFALEDADLLAFPPRTPEEACSITKAGLPTIGGRQQFRLHDRSVAAREYAAFCLR